MFDNIGRKIKGLAKLICYAGIIVSLYLGFNLIADKRIVYGIILIASGFVLSWIGSFVLYGFGELVENSAILAGKTTIEKEEVASQFRTNGTWVCSHCGTLNSGDSQRCTKCGYTKDGRNGGYNQHTNENHKSYWGDDKWQAGNHSEDDNQ